MTWVTRCRNTADAAAAWWGGYANPPMPSHIQAALRTEIYLHLYAYGQAVVICHRPNKIEIVDRLAESAGQVSTYSIFDGSSIKARVDMLVTLSRIEIHCEGESGEPYGIVIEVVE